MKLKLFTVPVGEETSVTVFAVNAVHAYDLVRDTLRRGFGGSVPNEVKLGQPKLAMENAKAMSDDAINSVVAIYVNAVNA